MPSARSKAFLLTFVAAWAKVRRLAVREPPVQFLVSIKEIERNRLTICCALFISDHESKTILCQQAEKPP
jgi:hypothetical protein